MTDSPPQAHPDLTRILRETVILSASVSCGAVAEQFTRDPSIPVFIIQTAESGFGLVDRLTFLPRYLDRFNRELYQRKPITVLMDSSPLVIEHDTPIEQVGIMAADAGSDAVRTVFIVVRDGACIGIGMGLDLVRMIAEERQKSITGMLLRDRALAGISQGITITDQNAPGTPIIYTNAAFVAMTRYSMDEIIGQDPLFFFDASVVSHIKERMTRSSKERRPWRTEAPLKRRDGTACLDSMVTTPIVDHNGNVNHSITVHEDVTEIRQREELLIEAQKMESVGQLTGGIAHDFNNLLTAIKSNAEDLRDDLQENPLLLSQAEIILEAADRGAGLVAQLMAFARKQELQPKVTNINSLLDGFTKLLRSTLPEHVEIETRRATPLPSINVDRGRLETSLLNLAINARDAMPSGGTLTIETSLKTLDADYAAEHIDVHQGEYVLIAVTDTGMGMPPDVVEKAFVPFFTTKDVGKGTGLGLSMVYGFVKQSGGHIRIYSEPGFGTVIRIYLPALNQTEIAEDHASNGAVVQSVDGNILLVEDDPIVRQSIASKLTRLGCTVTGATNALEALELLQSRPHFDLVLSDVVMPGGMTGVDLVREVRDRWPATNVLLTSGYTESTISGKIDLPTDVKLLSKPYSGTELVKAVSEATGRQAAEGGSHATPYPELV